MCMLIYCVHDVVITAKQHFFKNHCKVYFALYYFLYYMLQTNLADIIVPSKTIYFLICFICSQKISFFFYFLEAKLSFFSKYQYNVQCLYIFVAANTCILYLFISCILNSTDTFYPFHSFFHSLDVLFILFCFTAKVNIVIREIHKMSTQNTSGLKLAQAHD